jgi:molecular chaperone DnaJ
MTNSKKDLYDTLGVLKTATAEEIKKAFKKLAMKYHPDKAKDDNDKKVNEDRFKEINEAYTVLSDDAKRQQYDMFGTYDDNGGGAHMHADLNDLFGDLFSSGMPFMNMGGDHTSFRMFFGGPQGEHPQPQEHTHRSQHQDVIEIAVNMTELYHGVNKNIQYDILDKCETCKGLGAKSQSDIIKCVACGGKGHIPHQMGPFMVQQVCHSCGGKGSMIKEGRQCPSCNGAKVKYYGRSFNLKIPQGIPNKHIYKMEGKGSYDKATNTYNDIIIIFNHFIPQEFKIDYTTNNVHMRMKITLEELLCGFKKSIKIYDEKIDIHSECYFDPSKPKKIPNKGIPFFKKKEGGDLHIAFDIEYPSHEKELRKHHKDFVSIFKHEIQIA